MPATISQPTRGRPAASPKSASEIAPTDLAETLRVRFGYDQFLEGQQEVMTHLLAGRSAAAVFPTGGGKSLCYQLPALLLPGVTLVVSPLIALMKDQIDALARRGIPAARLDSTLLTTPVEAHDQETQLLARLREHPPGPTIIYVTLQKTSEKLAAWLAAQGFPARAYHAGLKDEERSEVQDVFMQSSAGIVVATIAFGMRIDKSGIRYVYHFNPPKSLENYAQEIGRAGRDGLPSWCELFLCHDDLNQLENFAFGDTPTRGAIERLVSILFVEGKKQEEFAANLHDLSGRCDIRPLVVRTLLVYLELDVMLHCVTHHTAHQIIDGWLGHAWPEWSNGLRRNSLHRSPSFVGIFPA